MDFLLLIVLLTAIKENNIPFVLSLIDDIDVSEIMLDECRNQFTLLSFAVEQNKVEIVNILIKHGAFVNQLHLTINGAVSALFLAIKQNNFEIVQILVANGASTKIGFSGYETGLLCGLNSDLRIIKLLIENKFEPYINIVAAINNNRSDIIRIMFQASYFDDIYSIINRIRYLMPGCKNEYNLLTYCIYFRPELIDTIICLLQYGADPNLTKYSHITDDAVNIAFDATFQLKKQEIRDEIIKELILFGLKIDSNVDHRQLEYEAFVYQIHFERYIVSLIILVRKGLLNVFCLKFLVQYLPCINMELNLHCVFDMIDNVIYA